MGDQVVQTAELTSPPAVVPHPRVARRAADVTRAREFTARRRAGETLQQIADDHDLSRERVRQVIRSSGGPTFDEVRKERERLQGVEDSALEEQIRGWLREHPGSTDRQVAAGLGLPLPVVGHPNVVRRLLGDDAQRLLVQVRVHHDRVSDAEVLLGLRAAADDAGEPLTRVKYDAVRAVHGGLSGVRVIQRFGSWRTACQMADVTAGRAPASRVYTTQWLDEDVLPWVVTYLASPGATGTFHGYTQWARTVRYAPSGPTMRTRLGPWNVVKAAALVRSHEMATGTQPLTG